MTGIPQKRRLRRSEGRPVIGQFALGVAWASVALYFGWKEYLRKDAMEDAVIDLATTIGLEASRPVLESLQTVLVTAARPDWTILSLVALFISLRAFFTIIGEARLRGVNARLKAMLPDL